MPHIELVPFGSAAEHENPGGLVSAPLLMTAPSKRAMEYTGALLQCFTTVTQMEQIG